MAAKAKTPMKTAKKGSPPGKKGFVPFGKPDMKKPPPKKAGAKKK